MNKEGILHHKIKFNDRVYLVDDINELLADQKALIDKKQDKIPEGTYQKKLVAGSGIEILHDGTINCIVTRSQSNVCTVKSLVLEHADETRIVEVTDSDHIYHAVLSTAVPGPFKFKNLPQLAGSNVYEIELWVDVYDPSLRVLFEPYDSSNEQIVYVGDTDYSVERSGQTLFFAIRHFNGKTFINKYLRS